MRKTCSNSYFLRFRRSLSLRLGAKEGEAVMREGLLTSRIKIVTVLSVADLIHAL